MLLGGPNVPQNASCDEQSEKLSRVDEIGIGIIRNNNKIKITNFHGGRK
jgi:hypothetical protein